MEKTKSKVDAKDVLKQMTIILTLGNAWGPLVFVITNCIASLIANVHVRCTNKPENEPTALETILKYVDSYFSDKTSIEYLIYSLKLLALGWWILIVFADYPAYATLTQVITINVIADILAYKDTVSVVRKVVYQRKTNH